MVSSISEDIEINVDDSLENNTIKRRKIDNVNGINSNSNMSNKDEDSDLQVVDDDVDIDVSGPAPSFIEEVMDEGGGGDKPATPASHTSGNTSPAGENTVTCGTPASTSSPQDPKDQVPCSTTTTTLLSYARKGHVPPNITATAGMMTSSSRSDDVTASLMTSVASPGLAPTTGMTDQQQALVQNLMSGIGGPRSPMIPGGGPLVPPTSGSSPVGMTAHALLEAIIGQVIGYAHTMNGQAPNPATTPTTTSAPFSPSTAANTTTNSTAAAAANPYTLSDGTPPPPPPLSLPKPDPTSPAPSAGAPAVPGLTSHEFTHIGKKEDSFKKTLDKIDMLERNTVSLDRQSVGIQRMVSEVVKKQEENKNTAGIICPRCRHMVAGGEQFISHLVVVHNFVQQSDPVQMKDHQGQAGIGTTRGWRYIRTKDSGTQSTLSIYSNSESKQVIDLTAPPPKVSGAFKGVSSLPSSSANHVISTEPIRIPPTAPYPPGVGYDSVRATASNILSFVLSNPDINKKFNEFAEPPKEPIPIKSPKKQKVIPVPPNYATLPFLQTINKQLQQNNGLALLDRMKEIKAVPPMQSVQHQKELAAQAFQAQQSAANNFKQDFVAQALKHQQLQQQIQAQYQQQQQQAVAAQVRASPHGPNGPMMHTPTSLMQSSMQQTMQPLQPTPIQATSLQPIRATAAGPMNIPPPAPISSMGVLKDQYQKIISGAVAPNAAGNFDENNEGPLKNCIPKVRASLVNGDIQLMWNVMGDERSCTGYRLFAYMGTTAPPISSTWTEVGTVKALPMPMAVTLSQFSKGCCYHFTVRAIDSQGNLGPFSEPCKIKLCL